jgi:site-specific DNA-methyltransferase (adenine-specific)
MPGKAAGIKQVGIDLDITAPATEAAKQWDGWGTALKPASEPIVVARKPFKTTVAQNVLEHGCGGLNIDGCRVETSDADAGAMERCNTPGSGRWTGGAYGGELYGAPGADPKDRFDTTQGRWPANVILSYPEDEYVFRDDVTAEQQRKVWRWLSENA